MSDPLLEIDDLTVQYETKNHWITAVSDASFSITEGEYFGLVGESGCGKSTLAKALLHGLDENGEVRSGSVRYKGKGIQDLSETEMREKIRWKEISYIPQSSMNSLDPLMRLSEQALEIGKTHTDLSKEEILQRFEEMFEVVGIQESRITDYPHQFSGGMQQRAIIALALFLDPSLIIADEPTTALDVIMQDQVFKYLDRIRDDTETSMLIITHDISLIFETCDRMAIMHGGQIAETGSVTTLFDEPRHPYSLLLQRAFPDVRHPNRELEIIEGSPPESVGEINTCTFADRCPWAVDACRDGAPKLEATGVDDQKAACIRSDEIQELAGSEGMAENIPSEFE